MSEVDDVTSGWGGVTSGHDLCELRGHVTFRDRSLLLGIVHYSTTWSYKQVWTSLIKTRSPCDHINKFGLV